MDSLDGTRGCVEEKLEHCQVLAGIAIGGEAVAGAIGTPFLAGNLDVDLDVEPTIVYIVRNSDRQMAFDSGMSLEPKTVRHLAQLTASSWELCWVQDLQFWLV